MDMLIEWLEQQIADRRWQPSNLAHAARLPDSTISNILNQKRKAGPDVCNALAKALGEPPDKIFRLAGLLPPIPPQVEEEGEILAILRTLAPEGRTLILKMLRGLSGVPSSGLALAEERSAYQTASVIAATDLECEIQALIRDFPELEELIRDAKIRLSEPALRALIINVRIFAASVDRLSFAEFHGQLSQFFAQASAA